MALLDPPPVTKYNFIALGAGVQSSAMALMAAAGEISPVPNGAIFADTGDEPENVYNWLNELSELIAGAKNPFPVYVVQSKKGILSKSMLELRTKKNGESYTQTPIPLYTLDEKGNQGMIRNRQCTADFKVVPVVKKTKELAGIKRGQKNITVTTWMGISWDELQRMKDRCEPWQQLRWPLIERRISRIDCFKWMESNGYPTPPRSACVYCPYHSDVEWRRLKNEEPKEFAKAVNFEKELQKTKSKTPGFKGKPYLHKSCQPLSDIDFRNDLDHGQQDFFIGECEGMCGV